MPAVLCNWAVTILDADGDEVTDDVGRFTTEPCGAMPVAVYFETNPEARRPDQPAVIRYPACKVHDTTSRRKAAVQLGYTRLVI